MIDHKNEDLIPFLTCGLEIPGRPDRSTTYRWWLKGVRGVKLETLLIGNKRFTSREAIARFIDAQNADQSPAATITPSQRRRQAETANKILAEAGL